MQRLYEGGELLRRAVDVQGWIFVIPREKQSEAASANLDVGNVVNGLTCEAQRWECDSCLH